MADELAASDSDVFDRFSSLLALAEGLLIRAKANKAAKASEENVRTVNSLFAFVFIIIFALSQI
ncbi:MAG TPA: hypothetical protein VJ810_15350 [Blastocatellia bacterium]|nr:hypothetical protein [Blastocatellia bacterium]